MRERTHQTFGLQSFFRLLFNSNALKVVVHPQTLSELLMGSQQRGEQLLLRRLLERMGPAPRLLGLGGGPGDLGADMFIRLAGALQKFLRLDVGGARKGGRQMDRIETLPL